MPPDGRPGKGSFGEPEPVDPYKKWERTAFNVTGHPVLSRYAASTTDPGSPGLPPYTRCEAHARMHFSIRSFGVTARLAVVDDVIAPLPRVTCFVDRGS